LNTQTKVDNEIRPAWGEEPPRDGHGMELFRPRPAAPGSRPTSAPDLSAALSPISPATTALDYAHRAAGLRYSPTQLSAAMLRQVVQSTPGMPVWKYADVCQHLDSQVYGRGHTWFWRPLRAEDSSVGWASGYPVKGRDGVERDHGYIDPNLAYEATGKWVPAHILDRAAIIAHEVETRGLPFQVRFCVSDFRKNEKRTQADLKDPWIMCRVDGADGWKDPIVFGQWDDAVMIEHMPDIVRIGAQGQQPAQRSWLRQIMGI